MSMNFAETPPPADLFDEQAKKIAELLNQAASKFNKTSQIRRFYDELVGWQERIGSDEEKFRQLEPYIRMLNAKVAYAKGRELVDEEFEKWFRNCIQATTTPYALMNFRLHFEAVLGFLKALRKD